MLYWIVLPLHFFSPKPGAKIVLSMAKIMTMETPPVTTVVTMLRMPSGTPKAAVTGFQIKEGAAAPLPPEKR